MNNEQFYSNLLCEANRYRQQYERSIPELIEKAKAETAYMEYSKGGKTLHRGYYFPGLVEDLITGNISRGRRMKRRPKAPDYFYYFDSSDKLRLSEDPTCTEVILYEDNREIGLSIDPTGRFYAFSLCEKKNGIIQNYRRFCAGVEVFFDMYMEDYQFQDGFLAEAEVRNILILSANPFARKIVEDNMKDAHFTQQELDQLLIGDFFLPTHQIVHFRNDGLNLVSYTLKELPRGHVKEYRL